MTDIVLVPVTGAANLSAINGNFTKIQNSINNDVLNLSGGNNTMEQDLDMNGNELLNITTDVDNPGSLLTVGAADSRYYNVSGDTLTGTMNVANNIITGLPAPTGPTQPVRKQEFDEAIIAATNDLEGRLASASGSSLIGFIHSIAGSVALTVQEVLRLGIDVSMFGAKPAPFDSSNILRDLAFAVEALGGGKITIGPGVWYVTELPLCTNVYWEGAGKGTTTLTQPALSNKDMVVSRGFSSLTGVGPLVNAPHHYGVSKLTVDGNYLADYKSASIGGNTTVNNTVGFGFKNFGSCFEIDVELVNCAQVGFYSEAVDYTGYGLEQSSKIYLTGRVFGKECVIYRGPADCNLEHVILGCPGWLPTQAQRSSTIVMSSIYPGQPVDVMTSDEEEVTPGGMSYNGHHEFGLMHLYGNLSGLAYRCRNTGRLKGNHLVAENCRGGVDFATRTWGNIAILECHNNQREPSTLAGTLTPFPDIFNRSLQGLTLNCTVRHVRTQASTQLALNDTSRNSKVKLNFFTAGGSPVAGSYVADISGSSEFDITLQDVAQDAIIVSSAGNRVKAYARNVTVGSVIRRVAGVSSGNRSNDLEVHCLNNCTFAMHLDGLVTNERLTFIGEVTAGGAIFNPSGSQPDMLNRAVVVDVSGRVGATQVCSRDAMRVNLDNTVLTTQTIDVTHTYFQTPDPGQISVSIYDPSPTYGGVLAYTPRVQTITATTITFVYQLSSIGSGGPLVLCAQIH